MDPTLTIALVFAIGWALSYRAKWKRAERQMANAKEVSEFRAKLIANQDRQILELIEKLESTEAALHKAVAAEWPRGAA
jgi:hypothetical protein